MKISELVEILEEISNEYGDLDVKMYDMEGYFDYLDVGAVSIECKEDEIDGSCIPNVQSNKEFVVIDV